MIRFNGYYIEEPIEIYDGRLVDEKSSYSFTAYSFNNDMMLMINSKHDFLNYISDFKKDDFDKNISTIRNYQIYQNKIIIEKEYSFAKDVILKVINSDKIFNETSGRYMYFVPWSDVEVSKTNNLEDTVIYRLFGPFYHEKYKVYFE